MPDWKSHLAVSYNDGNGDVLITPLRSFTPSFSLNAEAQHSCEASHIGVIYSPQTLSFSLTVDAAGPAAAQLTMLALAGTRFKILLQEAGDERQDWAFASVVMEDCVITSATPSTATVSGVPSATFSGFSLKAGATPLGATDAVTVPR
ncbi:hypothetical protein [Nonomuraea sp. NPDC003201]